MSIKKLSAEELLGLNKFEVDEENAHIQLDQEACARCGEKPCLYFCPAGLYTLKDGQVRFDYAGCLECGTCRVVCAKAGQGIKVWEYPRGTFGREFRYG